MAQKPARPTRIIELAGLSGTGKTTVSTGFATAAPPGSTVGARPRFSAPLRRGAYVGLMLAQARRWYGLYRLLRAGMNGRRARRRLRMYIKHLWRRRQQIRDARFALVVEDEAFATWFARDLLRCPGLEGWLEQHIELFYPACVGRHRADYVLADLRCGELLRVQRVHRRRLAGGPVYARGEHERNGTFASRRPAVERVNALLSRRGLVVHLDNPDRLAALARDPMATPPASI